MHTQITINKQLFTADLSQGKSIAITMLPNGKQPNHFGAQACTSEPLIDGDFIGDTRQGGSCNVNQLTLVPHCNGTHTESISHLVNQVVPVYQAIENSFYPCVLITVNPIQGDENRDQYVPGVDQTNIVITRAHLEAALKNYSDRLLQGLVIRTLPNTQDKKSKSYDLQNYPVFLTNDAMRYIVERQVKHLMVDFPSVDKMYDDGLLTNHRLFWNLDPTQKDLSDKNHVNKTITEMIFVDDRIVDGLYLCNLQIPEIETDAVPARPQLFPLTQL